MVKCYDDEAQGTELYRITAQTFELWNPTSSDACALGDELNVFPYSDPCEIDVLTLLGLDVETDRCLRWSLQESDVSGCVGLGHPQRLEPLVAMSSPSYPALSLMEHLVAKGFAACRCRVVHTKDAPLLFDERSAAGRIAYLQCVCLLDDIDRGGQLTFPSHEVQTYYKVLLRTRKIVAYRSGREGVQEHVV